MKWFKLLDHKLTLNILFIKVQFFVPPEMFLVSKVFQLFHPPNSFFLRYLICHLALKYLSLALQYIWNYTLFCANKNLALTHGSVYTFTRSPNSLTPASKIPTRKDAAESVSRLASTTAFTWYVYGFGSNNEPVKSKSIL